MLQNERRNFKGRWSSYDRSSDIMRHEAILDLCCHFTPKYFFTQAYMDALIVSFAFIQEKHMDGWSEKQVVVLGWIMPGETVCSTRIRRGLRSAPELCRDSKGKGTIGRCSERAGGGSLDEWWLASAVRQLGMRAAPRRAAGLHKMRPEKCSITSPLLSVRQLSIMIARPLS